jgi:DMSO/TMAO reductase YedYZ molybdopterin-dependent catalytic subunit
MNEFVSPGFSGRRRHNRREAAPRASTFVEDFPVLSAGPTPRVRPRHLALEVVTEAGARHQWNWPQLRALPAEDVTVDIHCVTKWSKLGTSWRGVAIDTLMADVETTAEYVLAHSYGGYTTNLPLQDLLDGQAWVAYEYDGEDLAPEHGGPARLLVPHLYLWKSAKWVRTIELRHTDEPGSGRASATTSTAIRGASSGTGATDLAGRPARRRARRDRDGTQPRARGPGWPGHLAGQHVDVRLTAPDGYSTQRSYSIASAPDGSRVELTVQVVEDGEVSPYLVDVLRSRRPARAARAHRRVLHLEPGRDRADVPRGRRLRARPAHGHRADPRRRRAAAHPCTWSSRPAARRRCCTRRSSTGWWQPATACASTSSTRARLLRGRTTRPGGWTATGSPRLRRRRRMDP